MTGFEVAKNVIEAVAKNVDEQWAPLGPFSFPVPDFDFEPRAKGTLKVRTQEALEDVQATVNEDLPKVKGVEIDVSAERITQHNFDATGEELEWEKFTGVVVRVKDAHGVWVVVFDAE